LYNHFLHLTGVPLLPHTCKCEIRYGDFLWKYPTSDSSHPEIGKSNIPKKRPSKNLRHKFKNKPVFPGFLSRCWVYCWVLDCQEAKKGPDIIQPLFQKNIYFQDLKVLLLTGVPKGKCRVSYLYSKTHNILQRTNINN